MQYAKSKSVVCGHYLFNLITRWHCKNIFLAQMASLNEKISALEAKVEGYEVDLKNATTPEEKRLLLQIVNTRSETLNRLLDKERNARSQGKISYPLS